jgi:hypothetical protein
VLTVGSEAGHAIASVLAVSPHGHGVPRHVYVTVCDAIAGGVPALGIGPSGVPVSGFPESDVPATDVPASGTPASSAPAASGIPPSGLPALGVPVESSGVTPVGDAHAVSAATHEIQRGAELGLQM